MADQNSSLPVRTQNNGDVAVKVVDATTTSQGLAVDASGRISAKIDDGSGNAVTSQANGAQRALDVGIDVSGVQIDPRAVGQYNTSLPTVTSGSNTPLQTNSNGVLLASVQSDNLTQVGGSAIALGQTTMSASLPVVIASNQSAINVLNTADGSAAGGTAATQSLLAGAIYNSTAPTLTNGQQASLQSDSSGNLNVDLKTPVPAGTNLIGGTNVYVNSALASSTNPLPVTITSSVPGTAVQNYQTSASLAVGASVTLTYTVPASHTFSFERVFVSASGKIKAVVQINSSTAFVAFNSTANTNIDITVAAPPTIAAAGTVSVIITNEDVVGAFDVYVTIEGNQN